MSLSLCPQIQFDNRKEGDVGNDCLLLVDGTDFRIALGYSMHFWSYKFKKSGLWYYVGLCIVSGDIFWWSGPYAPGKWNDLSIFRDSLLFMLEPVRHIGAIKALSQPTSNAQVFCGQIPILQKYSHRFGVGRRLSTSGSKIGPLCWSTQQFLVLLSFSPSFLLLPTLCFK